MRNRIALLVAAMLLAIGGMAPGGGVRAQSSGGLATFQKEALTVRSGGKSHDFTVELATEPRQQMQGLMFRRHLAPDAGMLFVYKRPTDSPMWMKNTLVPLDMLFIRPGGKIGRIAERTVPMSEAVIPSGGPVIAVLEVNAGTASRLGIRVGDRVVSPALPGASD